MNPGRLRHRITFLRHEAERNEVGADVFKWKPWRTVWASVEPQSGTETDELGRFVPEVRYKIVTRYLQGVTSDMKVEYKDKTLTIKAVLNQEERNRYLELTCVEEE